MKRQETISSLLENMGTVKRGMYGYLQLRTKTSGMSSSQLELLFTVKQLQPISSKKLAAQLNLTPGFISQLVDGMEQQGWMQREVDPTDRRIQALRLSKQGQAMLQDIEKHRHKQLGELMEALSDDELATWLRIQHKMMACFQTQTAHERKDTI